MKDFGTAEQPIRASRLPALLRCPLGAVLEMLGESEGGPAADTGSAVHYAARALHTEAKRDVAAALEAMREHLPDYPLADMGTADQHFRACARDPRNADANVVLCEEKIVVSLPAPEGDSSPVVITGTLDQVREARGVLTIWDIKTGGSYEGPEMLAYHAVQLMAYQVGASLLLKRDVAAAGVIRTRDYLKTDRSRKPKPGPVFWSASWTLADAREMMDQVRRIVGDIRMGNVRVSPSAENCKWCPGSGVANCLPRRKSLKLISA